MLCKLKVETDRKTPVKVLNMNSNGFYPWLFTFRHSVLEIQ